MHETTDRKPSQKKDDSEQNAAAESDATSKETVSDLEEKGAAGLGSSEADLEPSPDGWFDESKETGPI